MINHNKHFFANGLISPAYTTNPWCLSVPLIMFDLNQIFPTNGHYTHVWLNPKCILFCYSSILQLCSVTDCGRDRALLLCLSSEPSVRHIICLLGAPVTLKKLISVSLTVYLEVHHILCNSHGTFQKSVCCPCPCRATLLKLLTGLNIKANSVPGFEKRPVCLLELPLQHFC